MGFPAFRTLAACALAATPALAGGIDWLPTLEQGLAEAKLSGRAVLYVTLWKPGT